MTEGNESAFARPASIICGGQPDHEHNNEWTQVETFEGGNYLGPTDEVYAAVKEKGERIQMDSVACSVCGSSAFNRDVYFGL